MNISVPRNRITKQRLNTIATSAFCHRIFRTGNYSVVESRGKKKLSLNKVSFTLKKTGENNEES